MRVMITAHFPQGAALFDNIDASLLDIPGVALAIPQADVEVVVDDPVTLHPVKVSHVGVPVNVVVGP